ncbi:MAG: polyhydroxyalkanoate synthesis regulator [bacterium]|nr:polyhydroxyalkanoate synthesis regulator [bacterium]
MDMVKKLIMAGLGAAALTEEKVSKIVDELVKKGEISEHEGKGAVKGILSQVEENKKFVEEKIQEHMDIFLKKAKIATLADVEKLEKRIEKLEKNK